MVYSRKEIEVIANNIVNEDALSHISDMLEEIQKRIFSQIRDELYYTPDSFTKTRAGQRNSKFVELCADEKWSDAALIADKINKQVLTLCDLFQNFVKLIKNSSEYLSIVRNMKLKQLSIDVES